MTKINSNTDSSVPAGGSHERRKHQGASSNDDERLLEDNKTFSLPGVLEISSRIILGAVFLYAGIEKVIHPEDFAHAVFNYHLLPDILINFTAITLPWVEIILGALLVTGLFMPGTVLLSFILLLVFIAAMAFNLHRGLNIHCGCFSTSSAGNPMSILTILRDALLLIPDIYLVKVIFLRKPLKIYSE